jgi:hypothetical protein
MKVGGAEEAAPEVAELWRANEILKGDIRICG